jgi:hypothetical protein
MLNLINRRKFLRNTTLSAAGMVVGSKMIRFSPETENQSDNYSLMKEVLKYRKIDAHEHVGLGGTIGEQIDFADRLGIEKLVVSFPISADSGKMATPDEFRECNNIILDAMKRYPDR